MKTLFLFLLLSGNAKLTLAGKVRSLQATDNEMVTIHLKMGRSTVIRFREKPQKVVAGNQNYFNIEFIGKDVTIQPQAMVISNLFVYGKDRVYGFILKVGNSEYDDLVKVRWESSPLNFSFKKPKPASNNIHLALKGKLLLKVEKIKKLNQNQQLYLMEVLLKNIFSQKIKVSLLKIFLTDRKGKRLESQSLFLDKNIQQGAIAKGVFFFVLQKLRASFFT